MSRLKRRKRSFTKKERTPKQKKEKQADDLWSQYIRQRDEHTCKHCGRVRQAGTVIQAHHIVSRGCKPLRHDPENGISLCKRCHKFKAHQYPEDFRAFLVEKWMGQVRYEALALAGHVRRGYDPAMDVIMLKALLNSVDGKEFEIRRLGDD